MISPIFLHCYAYGRLSQKYPTFDAWHKTIYIRKKLDMETALLNLNVCDENCVVWNRNSSYSIDEMCVFEILLN